MTKQVLYSGDYQITTQDVPDELTLAISISGCPLHCKGCHSAFTWDPKFGVEMTNELFEKLLKKNIYISCVLFYGGEWQLERLVELIEIIKQNNLKACLYTGLTLRQIKLNYTILLEKLDYIKVGPWIEKRGGLNKKTTNQKLYQIKNNVLINITNKFHQID